MYSSDVSVRKRSLVEQFYTNLKTLSAGAPAASVLNSRIPGSPFFTTVLAFVAMVSDAWDILLSLLKAYDPVDSEEDAAEQSLAFFELERKRPTSCEQVFTIFRTNAEAEQVVAVGATIQTLIAPSGVVRSYKLVEGFTFPAGVYVHRATFKAVDVGLATTITSPQAMETVSGLSGLSVAAGSFWMGQEDNPIGTVTDFPVWVISAAGSGSFTMIYSVQGIDLETIPEYRARCFARWSEMSTGSTAAAYEAWARNYISDSSDSPVAIARVTGNQVYDADVSTWIPGQRFDEINGQEYIVGVEVAIALRTGVAPSEDLLLAIGASMLPKMPQNDVLWLRGPNMVDMAAGAVAVTYKGPSSLLATVTAVVRSFFFYDEAYKGNIAFMGSQIDKADIIHAVKSIDPRVDNVKVTFTIPGKIDDGDIVLEPFDQLRLAANVGVADAVTVAVV